MRSSRNPDAFLPKDFISDLHDEPHAAKIQERARMNTAGWSETCPRRLPAGCDQMFPQLTDAIIARIRRFGQMRRYERGARSFAAGEPAAGMFVVLRMVAISTHDGIQDDGRAHREGRPPPFPRGGCAASGGRGW